MQIGVDSYSFQLALAAGAYDVFRALDFMEGLGVSGMQININGPNGRFLGADPSDAAHVRRVRAALKERNFFVEVGGRCTSPDMLEWQLRLTADLGGAVLRTGVAFEGDVESTCAKAQSDLEASLPLARSLGVCIALENHEDVTAGELAALVAGMDDPNVGVCLDTGNDLVLHEDPVAGARLLAPWARTTHIKDQRLVRVAGEVYSVGVPLGEGDVDLPAILSVIVKDSTLDRVLVQDTVGYAAPLNPLGRTDLASTRVYDDLPAYASEEEALEDGLLIKPDDLSREELQDQADGKNRSIKQDVAYLHKILRNTDGSRVS